MRWALILALCCTCLALTRCTGGPATSPGDANAMDSNVAGPQAPFVGLIVLSAYPQVAVAGGPGIKIKLQVRTQGGEPISGVSLRPYALTKGAMVQPSSVVSDARGDAWVTATAVSPTAATVVVDLQAVHRSVSINFTQACTTMRFNDVSQTATLPKPLGYVVAADLNLDGRTDLVISDETGEIFTMQNSPPGNFHQAGNVAAGEGFAALSDHLVDMNDDGYLDAVVSYYTAHPNKDIGILHGNGTLAFDAPELMGMQSDQRACIADLNDDGRPDVVASSYYKSTVAASYNLGDLGFAQPIVHTLAPNVYGRNCTIGYPRGPNAEIGIVVGNANATHTMTRFSVSPNVTFDAQTSMQAGAVPSSPVFADINNDGFDDVLVCDDNSAGAGAGVTLFISDSAGQFVTRPPLNTGGYCRALHVEDIDGDGKKDLIIGASNILAVFLQGDAGSFKAPVTRAVDFPAPITDLTPIDANGDGRMDVAVVAGTRLQVFYNACE